MGGKKGLEKIRRGGAGLRGENNDKWGKGEITSTQGGFGGVPRCCWGGGKHSQLGGTMVQAGTCGRLRVGGG